jgi:hypothetical protein
LKSKRKVLLVGMLDSIHLAKWINRFDTSLVEFTIFPSKKFKKLHPYLSSNLNEGQVLHFSRHAKYLSYKYVGYYDFFLHEILGKFIPIFSRKESLKRLLKSPFDFMHAHELQGAGYLCSDLSSETTAEFMLSIWGSDLTYFADLEGHREKVSSALLRADSISAECIRDYRIAKKLGFIGLELPIIPVSASFNFSDRDNTLVPMIDRNLILVKTYGKPFGRGDLAIDAIESFLTDNADPEVFFYSVGPDLVERVRSLALKFSGRVNFSLARAPILQQDLYSYFRRARLYVGVSESDGISTSFLEAIAFGAYPIQTNTSCANEWEAIGVSCSLINVATSSIMEAMSENYYDLDKLQQSQNINFMIAKSKLDNVQISSIAQNFYFRNSSST